MKTWQKLYRNPELWDRYFIREKVLRAIRTFFDTHQFHEVETPLLIANPPAESYLDVFETKLLDRNRKAKPGYLSTSPEVPLKKLMTAGLGNCYALTKSFRNMETQSKTHNPEFTILEWYRVGVDYKEIMSDCEALIRFIHHEIQVSEEKKAGVSDALVYQGRSVDIQSAWERLTMAEAFAKWAGTDFVEFLDRENAGKIAMAKGYTVTPESTWEELYNQIFLNEVEPHLGRGRPTILYEFPGSMAALARRKASDPRFAERFEFYISGLELGDCYSELTDWKEQQTRFEDELKEIRRTGKTTYDYDHDFIEALKVGLPDCSGIAVGVDRLVMLFADAPSIQDTLFFPVEEMFETGA
ncbi:EF-P lysine aminoacylase GenX [Candidatus Gottesmanbacteria bacterium]|nr:EF-P lysine aminoacylase GenX [Candidatus Gottesmanbacteria bacterium]